MVIGSEGILGIITEAWMRIQKRPSFRATAGILFPSWEAGYEAVRNIVQAKLWPANLRILDPAEAQRAAGKGAAAFYIRPNPVEGRNYYHDDLEPLWAVLEEIGKPVCIHDSGSPHLPSYGDRMHTHTAGHIIAHPFEAMVAMMSLIWFGVIEKHQLKSVLRH